MAKASNKKIKFPTKTGMNLFYRVDRTTRPATAMLYILFAIVLLLALAKFGVYDLWTARDQARHTLDATQAELNGYYSQLVDYDQVLEEYTRYSYGYLSEDEAALVDRMDMLAVVESVLMEVTAVENVSLSGNSVAVRFSGVDLERVAELSQKLEASDLVQSVSVNTASTIDAETARNIIVTNMVIYMAEGGEQ